MRSLYGRRFCLACSPYATQYAADDGRDASVRSIPGRDEWFFRSLDMLLALLSPRGATLIARTGVAIFGISLLLPMFLSSMVPRRSAEVDVAATAELDFTASYELPALPEPIARSRAVRATPEPIAQPAPRPPAAASGSAVTVSWYGPGFYGNRLPCWQWLAAQGLPIEFLPDTWGVAHKSLPCGTMVALTRGPNTVTVPVLDRGPYVVGREFDLSPRVKAALGCGDLCTVVMQLR